MKSLIRYFTSLTVFASIVISQDAASYEPYHAEPQDPSRASEGSLFKGPTFTASPQNRSVPEGSDVTFPCDYDARGTQENLYMMIFKYVSPKDEDRIYYAGDTKVAHFPRIKKSGSSFILSSVKPSDGGSYVCRFETKPLTQISHRLEVLYPPKVWRESAELQRVPQGSNVLLQCSAEGNPTPTITWTRQGGFLPSGAQREEGFSMTLEEVDRHVEGTYTCTASNGIGSAPSATMTVQVEYPPEIISEQSMIHTGEGDDAKLVCVVHGRPSPDVTWVRGVTIVKSNKHVMTHDGAHRHTLTITDVTEEDFGEYTCNASNSIGSVNNKFQVTGLPRKPQMTSSPEGAFKTSYTLLCATETSSPLVQYRLRYRKIKVGEEKGSFEKWIDSSYFPNNKNISQVRQGVYQIRHTLKYLNPGETFEATVQVENKFGWSQTSDVFRFSTKKEDPTTTTAASLPQTFNHGPKVEEVAAVGQSSNECSARSSSFLAVFSTCLVLFIHRMA